MARGRGAGERAWGRTLRACARVVARVGGCAPGWWVWRGYPHRYSQAVEMDGCDGVRSVSCVMCFCFGFIRSTFFFPKHLSCQLRKKVLYLDSALSFFLHNNSLNYYLNPDQERSSNESPTIITFLEGVIGRAVHGVGLRSLPAASHGLQRKDIICKSQNYGPGDSLEATVKAAVVMMWQWPGG